MYFGGIKKQLENEKFLKLLTTYFTIILICFIASKLLTATIWEKNVNLLHTVFELICIFIALTSFIIVFLTHEVNQLSNRIIGFGFLAVAVFDALHTYYYVGLNLYPAGFQDLTTRYWLVGRFGEACILIFSATLPLRIRMNKWMALFVTLLVTMSVSLVLFYEHTLIPVLFNDLGVTFPKIVMEYIIIAAFIIAFFLLKKRRNKRRDILSYNYIYMAILLVISAELCFTIFRNITSFYFAFGHVLKVVYYFYLFLGIFVSAVERPYEIMKITKGKIREIRNELRDILNGLPLSIITYNNDGRVSFINNNALKLLEVKAYEISKLSLNQIHELLMPENSTGSKDILECLKRQPREVYSGIRRYKTFHGKNISLNVNAFKYKKGLLASFTDAKKEHELANLRIQTRAILESIKSSVIILDKNYHIVSCNKAYLQLIEVRREDVIGRHFYQLSELLKFTENGETFKIVLESNQDRKDHEGAFETLRGKRKDVLFNYAPIFDVDHEIIGYIGTASEITALKEEQRKVLQQEKLAIIGQMGSGIVHETKNHLASIKGYCQLLESKLEDEQSLKYIQRIEAIAEDVNKVIMDFLAIAKPSETVMDIISLNETIESMRYMLESPSFMRNVIIEIIPAEHEKDIKADSSQIKQIILNMAKNAIEAMQTIKDARLRIQICLSESGAEMLLTISDNGKGISEENLKKIGTPFFTTKDSGTGLGLSVCYKIIQEHGARIEVESEEDQGTTFRIAFPCYEEINA
ncbi:MAG: ATP-binding protein [Clostridia bacterium]|nr:ATP-binding protein [Clostridia bacterium]